MIRTFLIILLLAFVQVAVAQDSTAIQKLQAQFRGIYYSNPDPAINYFKRMYSASTFVFNLENDAFFEELTSRKKKNKNIPNDSLAGKIFDSVVTWFTQNHLWDNNPDAPSKYKTIFSMYNEKMCPCIADKLWRKNNRIDQSDVASCVASLALDTSYANTVRREAGSVTVNELMNISQLAGVYVFQKCAPLYRFMVMIPRDEVTGNASARIRWYFHDAERKVVDLYNAKSFARLTSFFPAYKNYSEDISGVKGLLANKQLTNTLEKKEIGLGKTEVTKIYYSNKDDKPVIYGQVVYVFVEEDVDGSLLSLRFTPTSKIKNIKEVLKKIEEDESLAPPEVMELQDTKIEVVPVDSLKKKKGKN